MSRWYVAESQFSVTGAAADHRLPLRSGEIPLLLAHLEWLVRSLLGDTTDAPAIPPLGTKQEQFVRVLAGDLVEHRGSSLVAVGPSQPFVTHVLACLLNHHLGNAGKIVRYIREVHAIPTGSLVELAADIQSQTVDTLIIVGGNPVYDAPADVRFGEHLAKVTTSIRIGQYEDETSALCSWHLPEAHPFESWGDVLAGDGSINITQPLIEPLLAGRPAIEVLSALCDDRRSPERIVRDAIEQTLENELGDDTWRRVLHDGFLKEPAPFPPLAVMGEPQTSAAQLYTSLPVDHGKELVFTPSSSTLDGRLANNGWLQESPDFLTKLTWDNAALLSPKTSAEWGIEHGQVVRLRTEAGELRAPVFVLPGQAEGSVGLAIGYGRTAAGLVGGHTAHGVPAVGVNASQLRSWQSPSIESEFELIPTDERVEFATTQDHHAIDTVGLEETGRRVGQLVREGSLAEYLHHPDFAQHLTHHPPLESLWTEPSYDGHAWGMSIDLNKCLGCNACLLACQAENNVPIVGKDQVARGREMHWIRVDRYFTGGVEDPQVATQPVACHHCENAPCEQVCPVAATVHSDEGLNDMIYNRCVGTRYCANNCPYKVRRFNFFDYNKELEQPSRQLAQLVINPEVTVRSRGVMEKCTYCVQRIQSVKIDAKNERRLIRDGEIQTACQAACPTRAIEFGDLNNPDSRVAAAHADPRAYGMLSELNVKPRTKYLARIRNPHPAFAQGGTASPPKNGHSHGHS